MTIKEYKTGDLIPYENNPRNNDAAVEAVANSIKAFGFKVPIVIDKNNVVVAGHTRLKAAEMLGLEMVPCIVADDLTDAQIKAFRVADNKTAELAEWDFEKLEAELAELNAINFQMEQFGFDGLSDDLSEIIEDEIPEVDEENEPITKAGDVWQLGNHRLLCASATEEKNVLKIMNGEKADIIFTDPPYNVDYEGGTKEALKIQNDKQTSRDFYTFLYHAFINLLNVTKEGGVAYVCHAHMESINFMASFQAAGFYLSQMLVWNKSSLAIGRADYQWKHEPIMYGWKTGAAHFFTDSRIETTVIEDRPNINKMNKDELKEYIKELWKREPASTVIDEDKPARNAEHPTMKPIKLIAYFLRNSSKTNDIVVDAFGGSGSTLIACEQLNRRCRMIELDPRYCDVIINRWETLTGQKAKLLERID